MKVELSVRFGGLLVATVLDGATVGVRGGPARGDVVAMAVRW